MKSFKIKFVPIDEKGDWIQSDSTVEMDVVAEDENKAIIDAVTRILASYDVWDTVAKATIDLKTKKLTVKSDNEEEERYARITVSENDKLVISTLIVKIGT
jgi:hypothetical protein